ncbi:transposase [Saprospiraceae bacterium]|nr:transposase [Saprospiraceae bacterium]
MSKTCMICPGIYTGGFQGILSITIVETESTSAWSSILDELGSVTSKE